ncbi:MAG: YfhO family protein [Pirellulaceae bacterium]
MQQRCFTINEGSAKRLASRCLVITFAATCCVFVFGDALFGDSRLAFRDVSHFYQPLQQYLQQRIGNGELPLWNSLDQFGIPVAGESSTALFYPGNLVFHLGLGIERSLAWFVAFHLLLAAASLHGMLRHRRYSHTACLIAGLSYAFSGPVLFLYCNPPFLVGAAWLPLAFVCLYEGLRGGDRRVLTVGSVALAMMVLGGDPQTAGHVMLLLGAMLVYRAIRRCVLSGSVRRTARRSKTRIKQSVFRFGFACLLAGLMASIQLLPSIHWSRQSVRHHSPSPGLSRWIANRPDLAPSYDWWRTPPKGSHAALTYDFSVPPWQWAGIFLPHVGGDLFPINTRITRLLPGDGRIWTPSLFVGLVPAFCLATRLYRIRREKWRIWDGLIAAGLLLSLGRYGLVWAMAELVYLLTGNLVLEGINEAIGGPYWILVSGLVGYSDFRFPGKWLVFFCLGVSWLTADYLSRFHHRLRLDQQEPRKLIAPAIAMLLFSGLCLLASFLPTELIAGNGRQTTDPFFGPLDLSAAIIQSRWSAGYVFVAMSLMLIPLLRMSCHEMRYLPIAFVLLTACEMTVHGRHLVGTSPSVRDARLAIDAIDPSIKRLVLLTPQRRWPKRWQETSSPRRLEDVETAQRASLFMRWHLSERIAKLNSVVSLRHWRSLLFWNTVQHVVGETPAERRTDVIERLCRMVGATGTIEPSVSKVQAKVADEQIANAGTESSPDEKAIISEKVKVDLGARIRVPDASMITCVSEYVVVDADDDIANLRRMIADQIQGARSSSILESDASVVNEWSSFQQTALVPFQDDQQNRLVGRDQPRCHVESVDDQNVVAKVTCRQPVLVKFFQLQDGFWVARVREASNGQWRQVASQPVDLVSQGFPLPAGTWEVEFRYEPTWLRPGCLLSLVGWTITVLLLARSKPNR